MRPLLLSVLACLTLLCRGATAESRPWLFVSLLRESQIVSFSRDPESGELTRRRNTICPAEPACMSVSPDRRILLVSFRSTGNLASYRIDGASGKLTLAGMVDGGDDPAYLLPDRTGRYLLSAYYQSNKVSVHRLSRNGELNSNALQTIPTAEKAHGIALDSRNRFAVVPHTGANRIYQFRFDASSGRLSPNEPPFIETPAEHHPRHIALHPSDRWAYTSNEAGDSISTYAVAKAGTLKRIQTTTTLPSDFDGDRNSTARCEMTPDGRFVYVANRGHDSIACFAIDQQTGLLTALGQVETEKTPRSFTIDPSGRFLYAAGQGSGRVAAFRIQPDGRLQRFGTYESGPVSWWAIAVDVPL